MYFIRERDVLTAMKKGIITVFLAILCTFLFYGMRYMNSPLLAQKASYGTYEEAVYTTSYFVRDEIVYVADRSGTVYNHFSDGMRVGKDMLVSTVYDGHVSDEVLQELNTIDKKIENIRESSLMVNLSDDEAGIENKIEGYKMNMIDAAVHNDVKSVSKCKDAIKSLRSGISSATMSETVEMLTQQKSIAESKIGGVKQEIYAKEAGVFSTVLDGMEHILTPEKIREYTVEDFNEITALSGKTSNQTVTAGDSVCKVVNNHKWYVICAVATERLEEKKVGSSVSMRFDSIPGVEVSGKIQSISESSGGKSVVIIESTQYVEGAYSMRTSGMDLIFKSYSGYKVPINAIRTQDDKKGVLGRRNNVERFYECKVIYTDENAEYVIIKTAENAERKLEDADEFVLGER